LKLEMLTNANTQNIGTGKLVHLSASIMSEEKLLYCCPSYVIITFGIVVLFVVAAAIASVACQHN